jgi:hypothetical protein
MEDTRSNAQSESIFSPDPMSQSWQAGAKVDGKKLERANSAPVRALKKTVEDPKALKRVGSENPKVLQRRRSSFRAGGSKYQTTEKSKDAPQRRESKTIFADELGCELEEVCSVC